MTITKRVLFGAAMAAFIIMVFGCSDDEPTRSSGPIMTLSVPNLQYTARAGSSANPAQFRVTVKINGRATNNFTVTGGADWLEVATYGTDTVYVTARSEALAAGEYNDTLLIDSPDAQNAPVPLPVRLTVLDWLWTDPGQLVFSGLYGDNTTPSRKVYVNAYAASISDWTASTDAPWLTISLASGTLPDSLEVGVDLTGLANGQYTDSIVFSSPAFPEARSVLRCALNVSSWALQTLPDQMGQLSNYEGICMLNGQVAWIAGWFPSLADPRGLVYKTSDGGRNWTGVAERGDSRLGDVSFIDELRGWAVGRAGIMIYTVDGGDHWSTRTGLPIDASTDLRAIRFLNESVGWAIGTQGVILRTINGGVDWTRKTPTAFDLTDVCIVDDQHVWASGNHGVIVRTSDGGDNWSLQSTATNRDLRSVFFSDLDHGWAVGIGGTVLSTIDGGVHWEAQDCGFGNSLHDVWFADNERGWVVGLGGLILRTDDGGVTWVQQLSGTEAGLYELEFADENTGLVIGEGGTVLRTASGGF